MELVNMTQSFSFRRPLLAAVLGAALLLPGLSGAQTWRQLDAAVASVGTAEVREEGLQLNLPLVAEDGSSVPLTITADTPAGTRITRLELFAPANPTPQVATFEFGEEITRVNLTTRIRLSESQNVIAVAHTSDGKAIVAERAVRVTVSGCVAPAKSDPASEMKARVRVPKSWDQAKPAEVLTMITHPMVTGLAADESGNKPATRIIESFKATLDGKPVLTAHFFRSLAANPYLKFDVAPRQSGKLHLEWVEDTGRKVEIKEEVRVG